VKAALAASDRVFSHRFEIHYASHAALEPPITICYFDDTGRAGRPHQHPGAVPRPPHRGPGAPDPVRMVRVVKPRIGGASAASRR